MGGPIQRPLVGNELMFWGFDRCLPTNFAVFARVQGPLDLPTLQAALERVQARHPLMQATLHMRGGKPWFGNGAPAVQLEVRDVTPEQAVQWLARVTHERFDTDRGPLARALVMRHDEQHSTLAVVLHHTIGDGKSGINVLRDWVSAANDPEAEVQPLPPHPSLAESLQRHGDLNARLTASRGAQRWLKRTDPTTRSTWLPPEKKAPPHERTVTARLLQLDEVLTSAIAGRSRELGATVHGALHAAVGMSAAARLPQGAPTLTFGQPIDMRRDVPADVADACGCMISAIAIKERVPKHEDFWVLARRLSERVRAGRDNGLDRFILDVGFPTLGGLAERLSAPLPRPFGRLMEAIHPQGLILSNLGLVQVPEKQGPLLISSMGLAVNPGITSALTHTATTVRGRLTWMFLATEPLLSAATLKDIADEARERLQLAVT